MPVLDACLGSRSSNGPQCSSLQVGPKLVPLGSYVRSLCIIENWCGADHVVAHFSSPSHVGVYCLDSIALQHENQLSCQRKLMCTETITGICAVWKKPVIVCGTKAGSLAVYDLRRTGEELFPSFSTDALVLKETDLPFAEIESVALGFNVSGDVVLFALDVFGVLTFWRLIENRTDEGHPEISLSYLASWQKEMDGVKVEVPRWQHAEFIVMTTGPHLQRGTRHSDQLHPQRLEHDAPGTPWDFALNPFLESNALR